MSDASIEAAALATSLFARKESSDYEEEKELTDIMEDETDEDGNEDTKELFVCSADQCRKKMPLNRITFLPKDNILEGVDMILCCKKVQKDQNFILQKYLEAQYLAGKLNKKLRHHDWTRSLPFRICDRHFDENDELKVPKRSDLFCNNLADLIRRKSLFYMYGVDRKVEYPSVLEERNMRKAQFKLAICDIPGCNSNSKIFNPVNNFKINFFPFPIDSSLRSLWKRAISDALGEPFDLTTLCAICEKHFPNSGKIVDGRTQLPSLFDVHCRAAIARREEKKRETQIADVLLPTESSQVLALMPADRRARDPDATHCIVRCCPITSQSMKTGGALYELFELPGGPLGEKWIDALRKNDYRFTLNALQLPFVCERHFRMTPRVIRTAIPQLFLNPSEAAMNRIEISKELLMRPEPAEEVEQEESMCPCCTDVQICHETLRRFNSKMNTLMQHVNMLCVLEGVKEVVPRPFDDHEDDVELYGDPDKVAVLAGVRAASMFVRDAKSEVDAISKALNTMGSHSPRRSCALLSCQGSKRRYKLIDSATFEKDLDTGRLQIRVDFDRANIRSLFAKNPQGRVSLCENHWIMNNIPFEMDDEEDDDDDEARKLKEALAIPIDFQPKFKKRRIGGGEEEAGTSAVVNVEVRDDDEEDERLLSNNELLQRLLGGAIAGQVTGEIGDNGEVYEGGEEDAEMGELDNEEQPIEDKEGEEEEEEEDEEEREEEDQQSSQEEPPELE